MLSIAAPARSRRLVRQHVSAGGGKTVSASAADWMAIQRDMDWVASDLRPCRIQDVCGSPGPGAHGPRWPAVVLGRRYG